MRNHLTFGFIGLGLIGGSIAKAIKHYYPESTLIAHTRSKETMQYALSQGLIDQICTEVKEDYSRCDYIFLCAPVEANASYLATLKGLIKKDCIITDVGSTKSDIHRHVAELQMEENFIGGHPMAGSEKTGVMNSKRILLENAYYIVTPTSSVSQEQVNEFVEIVKTIKALPLILDYQEHDFVTAAISHLPHLIAASLVNLVHDNDTKQETMRTIAAGGFKDITRIASSSPEMWEQICMTNSENITTVLDSYINSLLKIRTDLVSHNSQNINTLFRDSREYRNSFSDRSSGPIKKSFRLYCELPDESGGIAVVATLLASIGISIKNIQIVNNREFEDAVLLVEFYTDSAMKRASDQLRLFHFTVYQR